MNYEKISSLAVVLFILISGMVTSFSVGSGVEIKGDNILNYNKGTPVRINNNSDFNSIAAENGWDGNGSSTNPYIIENLNINGNNSGYCIYIGNTTHYFKIINCTLESANGRYDWPYYCNSAIHFNNVQNGTLQNNSLSKSENGLLLYNSSKNYFINNTFYKNSVGMLVYSCNENEFNKNRLINNDKGFYLEDSHNNTIKTNIIFQNNLGVELFNSGGIDQFFHNNIINNTNQVESDGTNLWNDDYPSGGNYWSDYSGIDGMWGPDQSQPGSDGIGDEPYSIPGDSNNDEYPLIEPYSIDENPPDINSVRVSNKTNNSATIEWNTSELCTSKLTYSSFSNMSSNRSLSNSSYTTIHRMEISNLSSDKAYYFQVSSMDSSGNWNTDDNNSNYYTFKTDSTPSTENEKPNIIDVTTQIPYTGDTILMEANVTDDSDVSSVFLNYRFDNTTGKNITIEKITDNYMSYITIPSNAAIFEYQFIAKDDSNQWNNTNLTRLDVIDNDEPSLDDFSPDIGYTEENYTINISVEDNIKIKSVSLNYSYNSTYVSNITINHFNKSFITYPIKIPSDSIQLYYEILIFDFANNSIKENNTVEIKDNTNPIIKDVKIIEKEINVGTKTNFTINTKDNRGIDKIFLKVKNNKDIDTYQISENQGDIWFKTIQFNTLGNYTYWFYVEDSSNLVTKSSKNNFSVLDLTPLQVTTSIEKNIIKIDRSIKLKFNKNINRTSLSNGIEISPKRNYSLKWIDNKDVNISIIKPDPGKSFFLTINSSLVKDLNGVYLDGNSDGVATKNDGDNFYLNWTFETPPEIVNQNNDEIDKSSSFNLSAVVNDDFNISKVKLNYTDTNGCIYNISLQNNSGLWSTTIPRLNKSGILEYYVWAVDSSGLSTRSNNSTIEVNNPLEIICKNYSFQSNKQFKFSVSIKDPVGVKKVILIYENKKKIKKNLSLKEGDAGNGKWICDLELGKGEYNYSIEVVDMDGESKLISNDKSIEISESDSGILLFNHNFIFYLLLVLLTLAIAAISIYKLKDGGPNVTSKETIFDESVSDFTKKLDSKNKERCTICLDKFKKDTRIYECQGCEETYHINCIKQLNDCPVCGSSIKRIGGKDDRKE